MGEVMEEEIKCLAARRKSPLNREVIQGKAMVAVAKPQVQSDPG